MDYIQSVTKQYKRDIDSSVVFCSYKLETKNGKIWTVPLDTNNKHYNDIQLWEAVEGNNISDPGGL